MTEPERPQDAVPPEATRLDAAIDALRQRQPPDGPSADALARTREAMREAAPLPISCDPEPTTAAPRPNRFLNRRLLMRLFTTSLGLLLAVAAVLSLSSAQPALADVIERVRTADSVRYRSTGYGEDPTKPLTTSTTWELADGRERAESFAPGSTERTLIRIGDGGGRTLILMPAMKTATRIELADATPRPAGRTLTAAFAGIGDEDLKAKPLPARLIDGVEATGYEVDSFGQRLEVWTGPDGDLLEVTIELPKIDLPDGAASPAIPPLRRLVLTDFAFDLPVKESLFAMTTPVGYTENAPLTLNPMPAPAATPDADDPEGMPSIVGDVRDAVRGYADLAGGELPVEITSFARVVPMLATKIDATDPDQVEAMTQAGGRFGKLMVALGNLPKGDFAYLGAGRSRHDGQGPIFWVRDGETVWGLLDDLSIRPLDPTEVPSTDGD